MVVVDLNDDVAVVLVVVMVVVVVVVDLKVVVDDYDELNWTAKMTLITVVVVVDAELDYYYLDILDLVENFDNYSWCHGVVAVVDDDGDDVNDGD